MNFKAIALDMDGTLLNPDGLIDDILIETLKVFQEKGIKVFIATGRTQKEIRDVLPSNVRPDGFVSANGMGVYTLDKKISQFTLEESLLKKVIKEAREDNIYYELHPISNSPYALIEDKEYFVREIKKEIPKTLLKNELNSRLNALNHHIKWVEKLTYKDIVKVYFFSMNKYKIDAWKNRLTKLQREDDFSMSSSSLHNIEIMVDNVSKGTGITLLLKEFGLLKEDLLAVGDGENDLSMFRVANHAVAMKNAEEDVQELADEVTEFTYEQNGLYHYLKQLI